MTQLTFGSFSTRSFTLFASTALAIGLSATGLAACGDDGVAPGVDAATIDSGNADTGAADSGGTDTAIVDSGGTDTAVVDSGGTDTPAARTHRRSTRDLPFAQPKTLVRERAKACAAEPSSATPTYAARMTSRNTAPVTA